MHKEWLQKKITRAEAEAMHTATYSRSGVAPVPFGSLNKEWLSMMEKMQENDELWTFWSGGESFKRLWGRAGISIVRDGEIVDSIITMMS